jgi:hypothetical protein
MERKKKKWSPPNPPQGPRCRDLPSISAISSCSCSVFPLATILFPPLLPLWMARFGLSSLSIRDVLSSHIMPGVLPSYPTTAACTLSARSSPHFALCSRHSYCSQFVHIWFIPTIHRSPFTHNNYLLFIPTIHSLLFVHINYLSFVYTNYLSLLVRSYKLFIVHSLFMPTIYRLSYYSSFVQSFNQLFIICPFVHHSFVQLFIVCPIVYRTIHCSSDHPIIHCSSVMMFKSPKTARPIYQSYEVIRTLVTMILLPVWTSRLWSPIP